MGDIGNDKGLTEELRLGAISDLIGIRHRVYTGEICGLDITEIKGIIDKVNALAAIAEDFEMTSSSQDVK